MSPADHPVPDAAGATPHDPTSPASFLAAAAALETIKNAVRTARRSDAEPPPPPRRARSRHWPHSCCCVRSARSSPAGRPA